ncbi:hypothetical protein KP509_28G050600 [Ceratopteris richardii]|uniref:Uncharacterized protein n=1 Tax=Ceratopteris richardii TaxID=49495 RepID=A0A8T2REM3_CERRI|nr:hypothetical protein KP509_28G050600 [Ceratopteris richardii]
MELLIHFLQCHPDIRLQPQMFESLKPYDVRHLQDCSSQRASCFIYNVHTTFLKDSINQMHHHSSSQHATLCGCSCHICQVDHHTMKWNAPTPTFQTINSILDVVYALKKMRLFSMCIGVLCVC